MKSTDDDLVILWPRRTGGKAVRRDEQDESAGAEEQGKEEGARGGVTLLDGCSS